MIQCADRVEGCLLTNHRAGPAQAWAHHLSIKCSWGPQSVRLTQKYTYIRYSQNNKTVYTGIIRKYMYLADTYPSPWFHPVPCGEKAASTTARPGARPATACPCAQRPPPHAARSLPLETCASGRHGKLLCGPCISAATLRLPLPQKGESEVLDQRLSIARRGICSEGSTGGHIVGSPCGCIGF